MRRSVDEISARAIRSAATTNRATEIAQETFGTIKDLSTASSEIGDVINLIGAIAAQTNLLALNATIEAARAGESGRGFAVVATEVKSPASQTASATGEIATEIARIQSIASAAGGAIESIHNAFGDITAMSNAIAAAMTERSAAADEIARSIGEAARGADDVTSTIAMVSKGAGEVRGASQHTLEGTTKPSREAEVLSERIGAFSSGIRAA